ncbi:core histone H2A/H2B/H3/H4 [Onchocerca flexuosa]|uniref:Histone H2A n=2 Tax=Onchocerca flexuosa TaxID=387005 RepID=A0A183H8V7_9BILA|nr:core histone H2A/H2B/H3/H4 [Onchocerca flexuosa]VDO38226.1 unnamed protein product [Onchocerca flexuosa]
MSRKRRPKKSRSAKSGLVFPVGRVHRKLREGNYADRIGAASPIYLAAVIEYLIAEILNAAGNVAKDNNKARIDPRHIQIAIRTDDELNKFLSDVTISEGGVLPNIPDALFPNVTTDRA